MPTHSKHTLNRNNTTAASPVLAADSSCPESGRLVDVEVMRPTRENEVKSDGRRKRYSRQKRAKSALFDVTAEKQHATYYCGLTPLPVVIPGTTINGRKVPGEVYEATYVNFVRNGSGEGHIESMMMCNSVWACPVCAARITEKRRVQLDKVIAAAKLKNWHTAMITFTLSHIRSTDLKASKAAIKKALRRFKSGRFFQDIKSEFGWVGSIQSTEITYGHVNGWHPHIHMLAFFERQMPPALVGALETQLKAHWLLCLAKEGFDASWEHGLDVRTADSDIADYIAKFGREPVKSTWGAAHEMAKLPVKVGKGNDHYTPFQLLDLYGDGEAWAGQRFKEYAEAMKGCRQLVGLKELGDLLGIDIEEDDQIGEAAELGAPVLWASIFIAGWRRLVAAILAGDDMRCDLLEAVEADDREGFSRILKRYMAVAVFPDG